MRLAGLGRQTKDNYSFIHLGSDKSDYRPEGKSLWQGFDPRLEQSASWTITPSYQIVTEILILLGYLVWPV